MVESAEEALELQNRLAKAVITEGNPTPTQVCGVDVAYNKTSDRLVGAAVTLDATTLDIVETATVTTTASFDYIPGLFSFRETPPLVAVLEKLDQTPDLIICDGHGYAHPRRIGLASHLGVLLDIPTIGCAKKLLTGTYRPPKPARGKISPITDDGERIGSALRTQTDVKEVFVSPGHLIGFSEACEWVLKLAPKYRLPETTRQADQLANAALKNTKIARAKPSLDRYRKSDTQ